MRVKQCLEILALIGQGGQARVFLGKLRSQVLVSVKAFASVEVCERERQFLAKLSHPLIARFYGDTTGWTHGALVSEYVDGANLAILLDIWAQASYALGYLGILYLAHEILEALVYLESQGIVHGDLAAENILVSPNASIKVCDFGAASWVSESGPSLCAFGRRDFLAPEILRGEAPTRWSDLYALGGMLFELVTQSRFCARDPKVGLHGLQARLSAHPPMLYYLIKACLHSSPWQRPSCAAVAKSRLAALSERQKIIAKEELSLQVQRFTLPVLSFPRIFVDFFPTAYFGYAGS